jgi:hypothetical protein
VLAEVGSSNTRPGADMARLRILDGWMGMNSSTRAATSSIGKRRRSLRGSSPYREAERIGGALVIELGAATGHYSRRTPYRRRAELRGHGRSSRGRLYVSVEVDLGQVLHNVP